MKTMTGCGAEMNKLMDVSIDDVQAIETSIDERVSLGVPKVRAQVMAVQDVLSMVDAERTAIMKAIEEQVVPQYSDREFDMDSIDDLGSFDIDSYDFDNEGAYSAADAAKKVDYSKTKKKDIDTAGLMPEKVFPTPEFYEDEYGDLVAEFKAGGKDHQAKIVGYGVDNMWRAYSGGMKFDGNGMPLGPIGVSDDQAKGWFAKAAAMVELTKRKFDLLTTTDAADRISGFWSKLGQRQDALEMPVDTEMDGKPMEELRAIAARRLAGKGIDVAVDAIQGHIFFKMKKEGDVERTALIEILKPINKQQAVTFHTTDFDKGSGMGKLFYGIGNAWAKRRGILVVADSNGLTHVNSVRRTENGLSSAARTGGEAHVLPGMAQRVYGFNAKAKTAEQKRDNLARLALAQLRNVLEAAPEIANMDYDLATDKFTPDRVDRILSKPEVRKLSLGRSSLARAILTQKLMKEDVAIPEKIAKPTLYSDRPTTEYHEVEEQYKGTDQWMRAPNGKPTQLTERQWVQVRTPSFLNWFGDWMKFAKLGGVWNDDKGEVSKAVDENGEPLVLYHGSQDAGFMEFKQPGGKKRGDIGIFTTPSFDMARSYVKRNRASMVEAPDLSQKSLEDYGFEFTETEDGIEVMDVDGYSSGTYPTMQEAVKAAGESVSEYPAEPGIYALFANIRDPYETDFEGALWSGERVGQFVVMVDEEQKYKEDGSGFFSDEADAQEFAEAVGGTVERAPDHYETTDSASREGIENGDGAIIRNVIDDGGGPSSYGMEPELVVVLKNPEQLKSASFNDGSFGKTGDIRYSERVKDEAIGDRTDISKLPAGRKIPESVAVGGLENSLRIASGKKYAKGRGLKLDIQGAVVAAAREARVSLTTRTKALHTFLADMVFKDALYSLQSNQNAIGWYDQKVSRALGAISVIHPEINTEPESRLAFLWALAVTSNGLKVDTNFGLANDAYMAWKESGDTPANRVMPSNIGIGNAGGQINDGLNLFNSIAKRMGFKVAEQFMVSQFAAGDIHKMLNIKPSGEWATTPVSGASILGPKIGNGFYMNLNGYFDSLTMDRWLMRTFGRMTGTLVEIDKADIQAKQAELKAAITAMSPEAKNVLSGLIKFKLTNRMTLAQLNDASKAIAKATMKPENREVMNSLKGGEVFRKSGNNLYKSLDGSKEAPANPAERNWIRAIFATALEQLQKGGYNMTMADLQALLWYPERRLYDAAKSDGDVNEGYDDDDAPDYANAAYKLAVEAGADKDKALAAMDAAEARGTQRTQPMSDIEKDALITRMAFELAPDPADKAKMDAWDSMTDKQRVDATKKVRAQIIPSILDLFGVSISKNAMDVGSGGFMGFVNPNLQANFGFQAVDVDVAEQIAAAIGYVLDQASVALVDSRLDSPVEVIRLSFSEDPAKHAKQIFEAINKAVPEIDGFSIRGNNFDVLNFTGTPNKDIVTRIERAMQGVDLPMSVHIEDGKLNSKLVERKDYEGHIGRIQSEDSGRVLRQRLDGLREVAASFIGGRAGNRSSGTEGSGRAAAARSGDSAVQPAAEKRSYSDRDDIGFYSELSDQVGKSSMKQAPAPAWKTFIKALTQKGVKPDEIEWSGVMDWLDLQEGKVQREAITAYLDANGVKVEETVLGARDEAAIKRTVSEFEKQYRVEIDYDRESGITEIRDEDGEEVADHKDFFGPRAYQRLQEIEKTIYDGLGQNEKYGQYTLPGGENYKEVLLTLPSNDMQFLEARQAEDGKWAVFNTRSGERVSAHFRDKDKAIASALASGHNKGHYKSSHWDQPNVIAHIRTNDRTDADGAKTLFVEEVQSDFQQDYRKAKEAIKKSVESDFQSIVDRMKKAGVLEVVCD